MRRKETKRGEEKEVSSFISKASRIGIRTGAGQDTKLREKRRINVRKVAEKCTRIVGKGPFGKNKEKKEKIMAGGAMRTCFIWRRESGRKNPSGKG